MVEPQRNQPTLVPIKQTSADHLAEFFSDIEPWYLAYVKSSTFGYVAAIENDTLVLRTGRLMLDAFAPPGGMQHLRSKSIVGGRLDLASLGLEPQEFLRKLAAEGVEIDEGRLSLPPEGDAYSSYYVRVEQQGAEPTEYRVATVTLTGRRHVNAISEHLLDWELRAASPPFDSVQELASHFGAGTVRHDVCLIDITAMPVVKVDETSSIEKGAAQIRLRLPSALPREGLSLGYRVLASDRVEKRDVVSAGEFVWSASDGDSIAAIDLQIGSSVGIQCLARYAGVCHHRRRLDDLVDTPNSVRQVYGLFDPELGHLDSFLRQDKKLDQAAFEAGVSFLLSMHGFQVVAIGGTPRTAEAPDLVAWAPSGDLLVVECTTGLLKTQDKMAKLAARASQIRSYLASHDRSVGRVLSLEVTSLRSDAVVAEREAALKQGTAVFAQEELLELLQQTANHPDPDGLFQRIWDEVHVPPSMWPPGS